MSWYVLDALAVLRRLESLPELSPRQHSSVRTLSLALELFVWMEHQLAAMDAGLTSMTAFLASAEAECLPVEALTSRLQDVAAVERGMPGVENALADLWELGPCLRSSLSMVSAWLAANQAFLQPDDIPRELARFRLRLDDVVQKLREMRGLLEGLEAMASLGGAVGAINLTTRGL